MPSIVARACSPGLRCLGGSLQGTNAYHEPSIPRQAYNMYSAKKQLLTVRRGLGGVCIPRGDCRPRRKSGGVAWREQFEPPLAVSHQKHKNNVYSYREGSLETLAHQDRTVVVVDRPHADGVCVRHVVVGDGRHGGHQRHVPRHLQQLCAGIRPVIYIQPLLR